MVRFLRKYHKWIGIISVFFILMFCVSGIVLNHRKTFSSFEVSRQLLPQKYQFKNWNNGAVKGTLKLSADSILLYGSGGVWLADSLLKNVQSYHKGMLDGIENRSLRSLTQTQSGTVFGISTYELYLLDKENNKWTVLSEELGAEAALTDVVAKNDTLFVVSRSYIYKSVPPYQSFEKIKLSVASNYNPKVSLFKTMWVLHSGELFGLPGKLLVDAIGLIIILLALTGLALPILRKIIRRRKKRELDVETNKSRWKCSLKWHNKLGMGFFVLLLFIVITGTFLRPPLLIAIIRAKVKPIPYSTLDSKNTWNEKLRVLRYDKYAQKWLLYSSAGFYEFSDFTQTPTPIQKKPPVSVMGVTVLEHKTAKEWLVGSFSGLYLWNSESGEVLDAFTHKPYKPKKSFGPPVLTNPTTGYSDDFSGYELAFDYQKGAVSLRQDGAVLAMPECIKETSMPLWNVMLELHVGRLYTFLGVIGAFFIFFSGLLFLFILISGYIVYRKRHKRRRRK